MKKVDVLGTKYKIMEDKSLNGSSVDGVCKTYDKVILHRPVEGMLSVGDCDLSKEARLREVIRHELVHAFFEEAGLFDYCADEKLVDWIAKMFPKMLKAMRSAGGI